jgi:hypothetical protein
MAAAPADPLRSTLDNLQLDPASEADRPYLVAMLRRLGYTEREIEEVVRTGKLPEAAPADDGLAPPRDYRLVVPASDSRFALEGAAAAAGDSPFEDLERVEFEDPADDLVFESVDEGGELQWQDADQGAPDERLGAASQWEEAPSQEPSSALQEGWMQEGAPDTVEEPQAAGPGFEESQIDTFGDPAAVAAAASPRTRVRVRRVRAGSKEEAERRVAGEGRNVIKSVPVDIVERWGADEKGRKEG